MVFPGQGSQRAGMGQDFCQRFPVSRLAYEEASDALGLDVAALCFDEDPRLSLTEYAQPAILTTEIAMLRGLREAFGLEPVRFGGHSLGEYTALVGAGVLPLAAAARIVRERGRLMQQAVPVGQGRMLAVIGRDLDVAAVERAMVGLTVTVANDNSPEQIVLSGRAGDVAVAEDRLAADATLRLVPLDVSAPFHSPLMAGIEPAFAAALEASSAAWDASRASAVTSNFTGGFHGIDAVALRARLVRQISGTVRWRCNMAVLADGAARIVELGPGRPLRGFFKAVGVGIESVTDLRSATRAFAAEVAA